MSEDLFNDQIGLFPFISEESYPDLVKAWELAESIKNTTYNSEEEIKEVRLSVGIIQNIRDTYIVSPRSSPQLEIMLETMFEAIMHYRQQRQNLNLP